MENNKINIAELLRNCPPGMELDSPAYNNLYFDNIIDSDSYPIKCYTTYNGMLNTVFLTKYGEIRREKNAKCVIFPKGKTTWEGFVPPRKFKDGDILYINCTGDECSYKHNKYIFILKEISDGKIYCYCYIDEVNKYKKFNISWLSDTTYTPRFATEEEKQRLFDTIKENGYRWNAETKTLEKLVEPKFKDGDIVSSRYGNPFILKAYFPKSDNVSSYCALDFDDNFQEGCNSWTHATGCRYATEEEKQRLFDTIKENGYRWNPETKTLEKLVEPKFKVGDVVQDEDGYRVEIIEVNIDEECYEYISKILKGIGSISFKEQDDWKLVPDKIEPKFKVGDRVKHKQSFISGAITNIDDDCYKIKYDSGAVSFAIIKDQDDWELVSDEIEPKFKVGDKIRLKGNPNYIYNITGIKENKSGCGVTFDLRFSEQDKNCNWFPKFDTSTLKPFESRVLVRDHESQIWRPAIFGCYIGKDSPYYVLGGLYWKYCIPYEGNENLCGKKDDCKEYYKTWEE